MNTTLLRSILALSLAACSSSSDPGTVTDSGKAGGSDTGTSSGGDSGGGGSDTGTATTDTAAADETGGGDMACLTAGTKQKCINCCATNHMDGYNTFHSTAIACACKDTTCKTSCAGTFCAMPEKPSDATCSTCLMGTAAKADCSMALTAACGAGDCKAFYDCATACK